MTTFSICNLAIGIDTLEMQINSIESIRRFHKQIPIVLHTNIVDIPKELSRKLNSLNVKIAGVQHLYASKTTDIAYSEYETAEFNIVTSLKWLALLQAMVNNQSESVIFIDSDIEIYQALPLDKFSSAHSSFDIIVQDEGTEVYPRKACTGFMVFANCTYNRLFLKKLYLKQIEALSLGYKVHDQDIFNYHVKVDNELATKIYFLSNILFPTGLLAPMFKSYNEDKCPIKRSRMPILFHANCVVGIKTKKYFLESMRPQ